MWCWVWFIQTEPKTEWLNIFHQHCHKVTGMAKHKRRMLRLCSAHKRRKNLQNSKHIPHCFAQTRSTKVVTRTKRPRHCHHIPDKEMAYKRLKKAFIYHKVIYRHALPLSPPTAYTYTYVLLTDSTICDWNARLNNNNNNNNNNSFIVINFNEVATKLHYKLLNYYTNYCTYIKFIKFTH